MQNNKKFKKLFNKKIKINFIKISLQLEVINLKSKFKNSKKMMIQMDISTSFTQWLT